MVELILNIVFIVVCIALTVIVLKQEGKSAGLSALNGSTDTYWSKNKGRSIEGTLKKVTTVLGVLFIVLAVLLNSKFI